MDETEKIWMDGKFVKWRDAKVHVLTHTLHYGMGVFEGIRFYETPAGPAVFRLDAHIDRLYRGAETCFMKVPFSKEEFTRACLETIRVNKLREGYIRPIIFYGYGTMGVSPSGCPVSCAIAVWPWGKYLGEGEVKVKVSSFSRIHPKCTHADCKICGHYVNSIFASAEAKRAGFTEALLLDCEGNIAEGPGENLFIVRKGIIRTPPLGKILPGITRDSVIALAKDLGYKVQEEDLRLSDLKGADEAFFTGTAAEVTPIAQVDDHRMKKPFGEVTRRLQEEFFAIARGKNGKYSGWLTYVRA
jgi:branched-chain amino acid aminotransferase